MQDNLQEVIDLVVKSMQEVREGNFKEERSSAIAAGALESQINMADALADAEFAAKQAKNELDFVRAEVAISLREGASSKISEGQMTSLVDHDIKVKDAKRELAEKERTAKKWAMVFGTLKEAHIFFRNLDKKGNGF